MATPTVKQRWMRRLGAALIAVLAVPASSKAAFHLISIREFFPGTVAEPNAQYIVLQMYFDDQNLVDVHPVRIFDNTGGLLMTFDFPADLPPALSQTTILLATTQAATLFGVSAELSMGSAAIIPLGGGKICFDNIDCVSWGNYTGPATPSPTGTPYEMSTGLTLGQAVARDISGGSNPTQLDMADDTNNSAADFDCSDARPKNYAGGSGLLPADPPCSATPSTTVTTTTVTTTTFPPGEGQPIAGAKLKLKVSADPSKQKVVVIGKDRTIDLGGGRGSLDDPTLHGGSLRVVSLIAGALDDTYPLPAVGWSRLGSTGYRYRDATFRKIVVRRNRVVSVLGQGPALNHLLVRDPNPVSVVLTTGEERYCMLFGGRTSFKENKKFVARKAGAPTSCLP